MVAGFDTRFAPKRAKLIWRKTVYKVDHQFTAKARLAAEEARRDAEGCRRAQAIAAQAPDDEEVEIGDIRRL